MLVRRLVGLIGFAALTPCLTAGGERPPSYSVRKVVYGVSDIPDTIFLAPRIQAQASYPAARARFLKGLPEGHQFLVVVRVRGAGIRDELTLMVQAIANHQVQGSAVCNELLMSCGFEATVPEEAIVDWIIQHPDGQREGDFTLSSELLTRQ